MGLKNNHLNLWHSVFLKLAFNLKLKEHRILLWVPVKVPQTTGGEAFPDPVALVVVIRSPVEGHWPAVGVAVSETRITNLSKSSLNFRKILFYNKIP
jgi:hypothetical protein